MVDYVRATGAGGQMMIRDTGYTVEYWIKAGSTNTWFASAPYSWTYNGSSGSGTFSYQTGAAWKLIRSFTVTYSQTVHFNIGSTGTSGIGGPTNHSAYLDRATVPEPPYGPDLYNIGPTSITARMYDRWNGGATITQRVIGYGKDPNTPVHQLSVDGTGIGTMTGLTPGRWYYFWVSVANEKGWSGWGSRTQAQTHGGAYVKVGTVHKHAVPYVKHAGVWRIARPWGKVAGNWREGS